jgi:hypothetical protein
LNGRRIDAINGASSSNVAPVRTKRAGRNSGWPWAKAGADWACAHRWQRVQRNRLGVKSAKHQQQLASSEHGRFFLERDK